MSKMNLSKTALGEITAAAKKVTEKLLADYTVKMNDVFENYKKQLQ